MIPWIMCLSAIAAFVFVGLRAGRNTDKAGEQFLTGGRNFSTPVIVLSLFATSNTGFMFVGAIGSGYTQGIAGLWLVLSWFAGEWVFWNLFPHHIIKRAHALNCVSIPHYLATGVPKCDQHGDRSVRALAGAVVAMTMMPYLIGQNIAAGKALSLVLGITSERGVLIGAGVCTAIALLYCLRGGLRSSIMANALQGAFILGTVILLTMALIVELGGLHETIARIVAVKPGAFDPFAIQPPLFVTVFFLGGAVASFGAMLGLPTVLMRLSVAADSGVLKRAKWWSLSINYGFWALMTLLGVALVAAVPNIADPEQSLFAYARDHSPVLLGLVLCGISALILSTIDGSIMVGGSALSDDVIDSRQLTPHGREWARRLGLFAFSGSCLAAAVLLSTSSVFEIVLFGQGALAGGIGPVFMIATLGWRTSAPAMLTTIIVGVVVAIAWAATGMSKYVSEALPSFAAGLIVHWLLVQRRHGIR
jgi:Na+/proline symporter